MSSIIDCKIVSVTDVRPHPNADRLELANAGGWPVVVQKGTWKEGEKGIYICPDAALPGNREWAADLLKYTGSQNRVKAVKLRGEISNGILLHVPDVEKEFTDVGIPADRIVHLGPATLASTLGVTHYAPPMPKDLAALANGLPMGLEKTDEENWESLDREALRLGSTALATRKLDGTSVTYIASPDGTTFVCSRSMTLKLECSNNYTDMAHHVLPALVAYAKKHGKTIVARGELTGNNIQALKANPSCKGPLKFNLFKTMFPDEQDEAVRNGYWGTWAHFTEVNKELKLETVPVLGEVVVTMDLLKQYQQAPAEEGEGVVLNFKDGSYKAKSQPYDIKNH